MLRITRHLHQTARHAHQPHHAPAPAGMHAAAAAAALRHSAHALASAATSSKASLPTPPTARHLHSSSVWRSVGQSDDFFDPAAEKAKMKERMRLKREAEAKQRAEEEAKRPKEEGQGEGQGQGQGGETGKEGEAGDGTSASASASSSSSASSSDPAAAAPPKKGPSVAQQTQSTLAAQWQRIGYELRELKAYIDARKPAPRRVKTRPDIQPSTLSLKEWSQDPTEKAARELKEEQEKAKEGEEAAAAQPAYTGPTALATVNKETEWDRRFERLRNSLRSIGLLQKKAATKVLRSSERASALVDRVQDRLEEAAERWETSQDPRVWKARDMVDKIVGETETGVALGEIMQSDPTWNYLDFLKEMEEVMIPEVIKAFRLGDMRLLKSCTEGDASRAMLASFRAREEQKVRWDDRILDIRGVDVVKASLHDDTPFIHLTFVCQHVAVEYDAKTGEMKDPTLQSVVQNTYYSWAIKKDYDSPYYDWKIFEFHYQNIQALI